MEDPRKKKKNIIDTTKEIGGDLSSLNSSVGEAQKLKKPGKIECAICDKSDSRPFDRMILQVILNKNTISLGSIYVCANCKNMIINNADVEKNYAVKIHEYPPEVSTDLDAFKTYISKILSLAEEV